MQTRRSTLISFLATSLCLSVRSSHGQTTSSSRRLASVYLHAYSSHHLPKHDEESKEQRKPTFENPVWTRVLSILLVPDISYAVRCPSGRDPDISLIGKISCRADGSLAGSELVVRIDDTNMTHENNFAAEIALERIHPNSDACFRYIFSENADPYTVLAATSESG